MIMSREESCGCCTLRTWTLATGWWGEIFGILLIVSSIVDLVLTSHADEYAATHIIIIGSRFALIVALAYGIVTTIIQATLLIAVYIKKSKLIMTYLVLLGIVTVLCIISLIWNICNVITSNFEASHLYTLLEISICTGLQILFFWITYNYYRLMEGENTTSE